MAQHRLAATVLACSLAVVLAVRPCAAQMAYNTTVGQFPATEVLTTLQTLLQTLRSCFAADHCSLTTHTKCLQAALASSPFQ